MVYVVEQRVFEALGPDGALGAEAFRRFDTGSIGGDEQEPGAVPLQRPRNIHSYLSGSLPQTSMALGPNDQGVVIAVLFDADHALSEASRVEPVEPLR